MTTRVRVTEAEYRRAIRAARKEGMTIAGMNVETGIVIFGDPPKLVPETSDDDRWTNPAKWNKPGTK